MTALEELQAKFEDIDFSGIKINYGSKPKLTFLQSPITKQTEEAHLSSFLKSCCEYGRKDCISDILDIAQNTNENLRQYNIIVGELKEACLSLQ